MSENHLKQHHGLAKMIQIVSGKLALGIGSGSPAPLRGPLHRRPSVAA
jgi:hypothetical protein